MLQFCVNERLKVRGFRLLDVAELLFLSTSGIWDNEVFTHRTNVKLESVSKDLSQ